MPSSVSIPPWYPNQCGYVLCLRQFTIHETPLVCWHAGYKNWWCNSKCERLAHELSGLWQLYQWNPTLRPKQPPVGC